MNRLAFGFAVAFALAASSGHAADAVGDFYKGKNVFLQVGHFFAVVIG
jgi:hypothetical protein